MGQAKQRAVEIAALKAQGPKPREEKEKPDLKTQFLRDDFCVALYNEWATEFQVNLLLHRLKYYGGFGLIIPRKFLDHMPIAYDMQEFPYDEMDSEDDMTKLYKFYDAVMIKNVTTPIQ
jgi:hypothetical protein